MSHLSVDTFFPQRRLFCTLTGAELATTTKKSSPESAGRTHKSYSMWHNEARLKMGHGRGRAQGVCVCEGERERRRTHTPVSTNLACAAACAGCPVCEEMKPNEQQQQPKGSTHLTHGSTVWVLPSFHQHHHSSPFFYCFNGLLLLFPGV